MVSIKNEPLEFKDNTSNCLPHYFYRLLQNKIEEQAEEILIGKFTNFCAYLSKKTLILISDLSNGEEEKYDDDDEVSWRSYVMICNNYH